MKKTKYTICGQPHRSDYSGCINCPRNSECIGKIPATNYFERHYKKDK
jgi:hypothetical protein